MHKERKHHVEAIHIPRSGRPPGLAPSPPVGIAAVGAVASPAVASALLEAPKTVAGEAPLSTSAPAAASPSPDAALLQLFDEYMATVEEYQRVRDLYEYGRAEQQAKYPMPEVLRVRPEDAELGLPNKPGDGKAYEFCIQELQRAEWAFSEEFEPPAGKHFKYVQVGRMIRYEAPSAAARARADEIIKAHDKWWPKYWHEPREVRSFERQADRANKRKDKLRAKIDRTRAHTIAGLAVKAQVAAIEGEDQADFADTTLESIQRDMRAMNRRGQA
jgi:hypothetical protein